MLLADPARLRGLPEAIEACLEGPSPLSCVLFNPFGTLLASGCVSGEVAIWAWATRGMARTFAGGHSEAVTALLWSADGRQLLSASKDGTAVVWDVLSGRQLARADLGRGAVAAVSAPAAALPGDLAAARLVVSYDAGAAETVVLSALEERSAVPAAALDGDGRGARLLVGAAAAGRGALAGCSPCGSYVVSAGRGVLCLLRSADLAVLDVVKLRGVPDRVTALRFDASGRRLLVAATDRFLRVYDAPAPLSGGASGGADERRKKRAKAEGAGRSLLTVDLGVLAALPADRIPKEGSLLAPVPAADPDDAASAPPPPRLRLSRLFESQVERVGWAAAAFSPDGAHAVSALASPDEHIIYSWSVPHGYAASTLQAGSDGVAELEWHPEDPPAQLLALGASGRLYVWAKVLTQDWSAFAPDFETLADNREHEEEEEEFDVHPPRAAAAAAAAEALEGGTGVAVASEDLDVDIEGWGWVEREGGSVEDVWRPGWEAAAAAGRGPLRHLPVVWPAEPVPPEEREGEEEEVKEKDGKSGSEEAAGGEEEVKEEGGGGGEAAEEGGAPESNGKEVSDGEEGGAAKKARKE